MHTDPSKVAQQLPQSSFVVLAYCQDLMTLLKYFLLTGATSGHVTMKHTKDICHEPVYTILVQVDIHLFIFKVKSRSQAPPVICIYA